MTILKKIQILMLTLLVAFPAASFAQAKLSGLQVVTKVYDRPTGKDMKANLTMELINSANNKRVRRIRQFSKNARVKDKKIMFFISPADVRNTSFMTWSYNKSNKDDDQWIYLPALKKVKRISSDSKSDYFMGSDFTYDDLGDRHPTKDRHRILREEKYRGENCYVVESTSKDKEYIYSRTLTWIIKDKWVGLQKKFFDEDKNLLKILTVNKYKKIKGYWIILHSKMYNTQKKHTTQMMLSDVIINSGISNRKFSTRMMRRGLR